MLVMYCPHGICIGFSILTRHEGPRLAFELIYRRFTIGPRLIVYDNACIFHMYCLKRERAFFSRTSFLVDRFHWKNHKGCCSGYNIDSWPEDTWIIGPGDMKLVRESALSTSAELPNDVTTLTFGNMNSQVCEQFNSRLRFMATPLAYMNHRTYFAYVQHFMYRYNVLILAKMFGTREIDMMRLMFEPANKVDVNATTPERKTSNQEASVADEPKSKRMRALTLTCF